MADNQQFDNEASLREAKSRMPLSSLMQQHGDTPPPIGKKWAGCPFCKKKDTARITDDGSQQFFKCANDNCLSQTAGEGNAWTELHYLKFKTGLNDRDAFIAYLKLTNVWKERERLKSPEPEVQNSKSEVQAENAVETTALPGSAPPVAAGQDTPPVGGVETNHEQPVESSAGSSPAGATMPEGGGQKAEGRSGEVDDEEVIQQCVAVILQENRASVSLMQRRLRLGYTRATRIMDELEKRGVVGPSKGAEPRDILVKKPEMPKSEALLMEEDIARCVDYLKRAEKRKFHFLDLENQFGHARATKLFEEMQLRKVIAPIGSDFELVPTPAPTVVFISNNKPAAAGAPAPGKIDGEDGYAALHDFFLQLDLSEQDEAKLFHRRGVKSSTASALRFRSNPRTNRGRLLAMQKQFSREELLDSGLYKRVKNSPLIKPNSQFCGAGIIRKAKPGEKPERNEWMDDDGNIWGWCEPVLIPYFDEMGRIVGLRPHKGGGLANTVTGSPRIYIPRGPRGDSKPVEFFPVVIITEGEFKAAALWQTVGAARIDAKEPYGVVALPGIWFGQSYAIREELDQWLREVRCRVVKVAYDNEEKGNPELESFKTDRRKRFDAEICARTLATDIANKLHIRGEVCRLPDTWRNEKGKADWDGALVKITQKNRL